MISLDSSNSDRSLSWTKKKRHEQKIHKPIIDKIDETKDIRKLLEGTHSKHGKFPVVVNESLLLS